MKNNLIWVYIKYELKRDESFMHSRSELDFFHVCEEGLECCFEPLTIFFDTLFQQVLNDCFLSGEITSRILILLPWTQVIFHSIYKFVNYLSF